MKPNNLRLPIESATAKGNDGVGALNGPEHSRLFEPPGNDGSASGLDYTGANEEVLASEVRVAHALLISFEVVGLDTQDAGKERSRLTRDSIFAASSCFCKPAARRFRWRSSVENSFPARTHKCSRA